MKFMLTWRTRPGLYKMAFQQFLETGGPPPKGVNQVARYHVPGSVLGWHVLETDDMTATEAKEPRLGGVAQLARRV